MAIYIKVLGSSAGGGFPQWNCNCENCAGFRAGNIQAQARTQSSIAISSDKIHWAIINASPDILTQLQHFPEIHPNRALRDTGIVAIILSDAQIDHVTGLLMLREGCPHDVYCTTQVAEDLTHGFPVFNLLKSWKGGIQQQRIPINGTSFEINQLTNISLTAYPLISNAPPYSPHRDHPEPGDNIGLLIQDKTSGKKILYAPGVGCIEKHLAHSAAQADCILIDGTVWNNDEMARSGVGDKLGTEMGHLPLNGENGIISFLDKHQEARKILIHINNTNPILNETSKEREILTKHNIEVSYDTMEIEI